jgi:hypothetical protein
MEAPHEDNGLAAVGSPQGPPRAEPSNDDQPRITTSLAAVPVTVEKKPPEGLEEHLKSPGAGLLACFSSDWDGLEAVHSQVAANQA